MLDVRLFKRRPIAAGAITAFFSMFAMTGIMLLIAQWLQVVLEWSPLKAGIATLPTAVGALLFTPLAPAIAARIGARTVLASGLAMAGIGFLYIFLFGHPLTYGVLVPALVLIGISTASLAVASSLIMSSTPQDKAGNSAAIEESMYDLGNVFGVAVIGSIAAAFYRQYLDIASFAGQGISGALADQANKSIVDALAVSAQTGVFDLATKATSAFDDSILGIGLVGGIILVTIAIIVFALIPKGLDITSQRHD
jgi:DHA2 family multidrug resistance protein-like MFS transporter